MLFAPILITGAVQAHSTSTAVHVPPIINDRNVLAAEGNRSTIQSIVCRGHDQVTVRIMDRRILSVDVSGRNITREVVNAVDVPIDHVAFECHEKTFFLMPYSYDGVRQGVLSLRYE
jgi:hypothetical protein